MKVIRLHWLLPLAGIAALADLFLAHPHVYRCDPASAIMLTIAVASALGPSTQGWSMGLVGHLLYQKPKGPPPIDRGKLDDIRFSLPGYGEHVLKIWGKARGAPIWIAHKPIVHTTVVTPGQSGGKGPPKPPTPETTDHVYTVPYLAGVCHDGILYNGIKRIWFDAELVYSGDLFSNSALYREAEYAVLSGGASVASSSVCSNGRKVTGIGNGGKATFTVNVDTGGSYEVGVAYLSTSDLTFKVSINGGAATDVECASSGGATIVAYKVITVTLISGANTIEFANAAAACPDLDRIQITPLLIFEEGIDRRAFTGLIDPSRIFPSERNSSWPFQNEQPIPIDGWGTSTGASSVGTSATLTKWGSPTIRTWPGTRTQEPDSAIVADKGSGNVPAYRDFAGITIEGLQLQNGRLPNVTQESDQGTRDVRTIVEDIYALCGVSADKLELSQLDSLILGDTEGFSEGTYSSITWAGAVNATTGAGGSFAKSGGGDGWTAYANSGASISAGTDYAIRFTAGAGVWMLGFASTNTPGSALPHPYDQMLFAILGNLNSVPSQESKRALQMSLGGSNNTSDVGTWSPGDEFQIEIRDGQPYAYQNGALVTGFQPPLLSYPLKVVVMGYRPIGGSDDGGVTAASAASGANIGSRPTIVNAGALVVAARRSASEILNDLMIRFQFDMVNVDGKEKAILRNASAVDITIPYADLRAHLSSEEMPAFDCEITDTDPLLLPARVDVTYLDPQLDYHSNVQSDMLLSGPQTDIQNISLSVVESADNAKGLAVTLLNKAHMESRAFKFRLGPKYLHTHPGTVADLVLPNATHRVRFTQWKAQLPAGVIEVEAVRQAASIYSPNAVGSISSGFEPPIVSIVGNTEGVIIDGPLFRAEDAGDGSKPVLYFGACHRGAGSWAGAFLNQEFPIDSGNYIFVPGGAFDKEATIGVTDGTLASVADPAAWDVTSTLTINLYTDTELTSATEADIETNPSLNLLGVINPATDEIEVIQFRDVTALTPVAPFKSKYEVSTFLRGRFGTDNNVGVHTSADKVILINSALKAIRTNVEDIDRTMRFKLVSSGQNPEDAAIITHALAGNSLKPAQVTDLNAERDSSKDWRTTAIGHPRDSERPETYTVRIRRASDGEFLRDIPVAPGVRQAAILIDDVYANLGAGPTITNNNVEHGAGDQSDWQAVRTKQTAVVGTVFEARVTLPPIITAYPAGEYPTQAKISIVGYAVSAWQISFATGFPVRTFDDTTMYASFFNWASGTPGVGDLQLGNTTFPTIDGAFYVRIVFVGTEVRVQLSGSPISANEAPKFILRNYASLPSNAYMILQLLGGDDNTPNHSRMEDITIGGSPDPQTIYSLSQQEQDLLTAGEDVPTAALGIEEGDLDVEMRQNSTIPGIQGRSVRGVF